MSTLAGQARAENLAVVGDALRLVARSLEVLVQRVVTEDVGYRGEWTDLLREKDQKAGYANPIYRAGDVVPLLRMLTERLGSHGYPFSQVMPQIGGTYANELRSIRNLWAHLQPFTDSDTYRALDTAERLLRAAGLFDAADRLSLDREAALDRLIASRGAMSESADVSAADTPVPAENHRDQVPVDSKARRIADEDAAAEESDLAAALRQLLDELDRPIPMAALSQKLLRAFGNEAVQGWGAVGGFAAFIAQVEPTAALSGPTPGYVHPPGRSVPPDWDREDHEGEIPGTIRALRSADAELPLVAWPRLRDTITFAIQSEPPIVLTATPMPRQEIDRRSAHAIGEAARNGRLIYRAHVSWVLKALQQQHAKDAAVSASSAMAAVATYLVSLAPTAGVAQAALHSGIRLWLEEDLE